MSDEIFVEAIKAFPNFLLASVTLAGFVISILRTNKAVGHAAEAVIKIEEIRHETNGMRADLEKFTFAEGVTKGREEVKIENLLAVKVAEDK